MTGVPDFDKYYEQYPSVVTFEPLAQTRHAKKSLWKAKSIECENNFLATSRRAKAGLNSEPGTTQFR